MATTALNYSKTGNGEGGGGGGQGLDLVPRACCIFWSAAKMCTLAAGQPRSQGLSPAPQTERAGERDPGNEVGRRFEFSEHAQNATDCRLLVNQANQH